MEVGGGDDVSHEREDWGIRIRVRARGKCSRSWDFVLQYIGSRVRWRQRMMICCNRGLQGHSLGGA